MSTTASAIVTSAQKSLGATKSKNATVRAFARGLDSEKAFTQQADINDSHQNQLNLLRGLISSIASTTTVSGGIYSIPVIGGVAVPNLSRGLIQVLTLTSDVFVGAPVGIPGPLLWTLIIDQDAVGGWALTLDTSYFGDLSGLDKTPLTRSQVNWTIDNSGRCSINSVVTGAPIPS